MCVWRKSDFCAKINYSKFIRVSLLQVSAEYNKNQQENSSAHIWEPHGENCLFFKLYAPAKIKFNWQLQKKDREKYLWRWNSWKVLQSNKFLQSFKRSLMKEFELNSIRVYDVRKFGKNPLKKIQILKK